MTSALLPNRWTLYHHDPENKDWDMSGYDVVMSVVRTEEALALCNYISDDSIKHTMWFLMKEQIQPRWEDPENVTGGYYQYRVANKYAVDVWRALFLHCCSGGLLALTSSGGDDTPSNIVTLGCTASGKSDLSPKDLSNFKEIQVNGVSIAPRAYFCTIKIWLNQIVSLPSDQLFVNIPNLTHYGPPAFVANKK